MPLSFTLVLNMRTATFGIQPSTTRYLFNDSLKGIRSFSLDSTCMRAAYDMILNILLCYINLHYFMGYKCRFQLYCGT